MWSIGIVMHCILAGTFPFTSPTEADRNFRLHKQSAWKPSFPEEDEDCIKLVLKLLEIDPFKRPKAGECLDSQWLRVKPTKTAEEILKNINEGKTTGKETEKEKGRGVKRQRQSAAAIDDDQDKEKIIRNNDDHHRQHHQNSLNSASSSPDRRSSSNALPACTETNGEMTSCHQQQEKKRRLAYVACKFETPLAALAVEKEEEEVASAAASHTIRGWKGEQRKGADNEIGLDSKDKFQDGSTSHHSGANTLHISSDDCGEKEARMGSLTTTTTTTATKAVPTSAAKSSSNPRNEKHIPVKRLGWILPGKSVEKSNKFLDQIGQAVAEIGFDAELDTDDFFVVGRDMELDQDMFIVTLFQQEVKGKEPNLLLDVQRLNLPPLDFNEVYRSLRLALKDLNQWNGHMMASS
mmetsp:Transcript_10773/g.14904  ORF Transcript_10773/g.14904 Transcript_10773/m.14904 type:complete len:408 (+) Transcript_10773:872-2095(+)